MNTAKAAVRDLSIIGRTEYRMPWNAEYLPRLKISAATARTAKAGTLRSRRFAVIPKIASERMVIPTKGTPSVRPGPRKSPSAAAGFREN